MSSMPRRAQARYNGLGGVALTFPYDARLVDLLKREIPAYARSYDGGTKTWTVTSAYAPRAVDLLLRCFPDARIERPSTRPAPEPIRLADAPLSILHLRETAPRELIDAAYRCLAKIAHPDQGGDSESMRRLTEAHEALSRRVSA